MRTSSFARFLVPATLLISPVAASAQQQSPSAMTQVAENTVASAPAAPMASSTVSAAAAAPVADKKICKLLPSSYSHMSVRTCLTEKEWKQVQDSDQ